MKRYPFTRRLVLALALLVLPALLLSPAGAKWQGLSGAAQAQGTRVSFGAGGHDSSLPVEITAEEFRIDQGAGVATFTGSVLVVQGEMRLSAGAIRVEYGAPGTEMERRIARLHASDGVTMVSGEETAEAADAIYNVEAGLVQMRGEVMITQGPAFIAGDAMEVDLATGAGVMTGQVRTLFQPGGSRP